MAIMSIIENDGDDIFDMIRYNQLIAKQQQILSKETSDNISVDSDEEDIHVKVIDDEDGSLLFNQKRLQQYILHCGQNLDGGLRGALL